jgi:hypothetical protein
MKSHPGADIDVEIRVMYPVHTPKCRHGVKQQMEQVQGQIEGQQRHDKCQEVRERKHVEESDTPPADVHGERHRSQREQHSNKDNINRSEHHMIGPTNRLRYLWHPQGGKNFPERHKRECAEKEPKSDHRLVIEKKCLE